MISCTLLYVIVSLIEHKMGKPDFNLDKMLHRGIYNTDGEKKEKMHWSWKTVFSKLIGITPEYTRSDRVIAWSVFLYSFL